MSVIPRVVIVVKGFTIIELVIVIVLISGLSAVAVPKLMSLSDDAHKANHKAVTSSFISALELSKAKWNTQGRPTVDSAPLTAIDITGDGLTDIGYSSDGWVIAASNGEQALRSYDIIGTGTATDICAQIATMLLGNNGATFAAMTAMGTCDADYCTRFGSNICQFYYQGNSKNDTWFGYSPQKGVVFSSDDVESIRDYFSDGFVASDSIPAEDGTVPIKVNAIDEDSGISLKVE